MRTITLASLTFALVVSTTATALAREANPDAIVGGDATLYGLTGLVNNPEAYTGGVEQGMFGVNLLWDDNDKIVWSPALLYAIDDRFELGGFGFLGDDNTRENVAGASLKFKFYDEKGGGNIGVPGGRDEAGFPSMAAFYTYEGSSDLNRHRFGLAVSWTFLDEESTDKDYLSNTSFTIGGIYNINDSGDSTVQVKKNNFDWYAGVVFRPDQRWSIALEYEDDDDTWMTDGFAGALRWHLNPDSEETMWTVQAGVTNTDNLLLGVQAGF